MSKLAALHDQLDARASITGDDPVITGDVLFILDGEVRVLPYGTPTDGDVWQVDTGDPSGWVLGPQTGGGGGGVTHHDDLDATELAWTLSAHTGTAATLAGFDGAGNADEIPVTDFAPAAGVAYLLLVADAAFPQSREFLVDGTSIRSVDLGPGSTYTIDVNPSFYDDIVRGAEIGVPRFAFTEKLVCWCCVSALNTGTSNLSQSVRYIPHYEEGVGPVTYDAMCAFQSTASAGNTVRLALYAADLTSNGYEPGDRLWLSATSSTAGANTSHQLTFAAGAWDAAGANYKDGSDRLVLLQGQVVILASLGSAALTWRVLNAGTFRNIGLGADGSTFYQGWTEAGSAFPTSATPVTSTNQTTWIGLRRL